MLKRVLLALGSFAPLALPAQGASYGPALRADSLANTPIGKGGVQVSCRFRADPGGVFQGARPFLIWSFKRKGYHAGSGGTLKVELQTDDGTPQHRPSGQVLAANVQRMALAPSSDRFYPLLAFDRAPVLKPGALFHLVFSNSDPDPEDNFLSINALFVKSRGGTESVQPGRPDSDWAMLIRSRTRKDWTLRRTPGSDEGFTPILEIDYAGGRSQGVGYMEFWMGAPKPVGGAAAVREVFTVTGPDRPVAAVAVRVRQLAGTGPLTLRLEQGDGKLLASGDVPGPAACTPSASLGGCDWAAWTLPKPLTLAAGHGYRLVLSATGKGSFEAFPMRKGTDKGFSDATLFADGHAEYSDGSGWAGWEQWGKGGLTNSDLQFYFRLQAAGARPAPAAGVPATAASPGAATAPPRSVP
jgi:hypothetical protein